MACAHMIVNILTNITACSKIYYFFTIVKVITSTMSIEYDLPLKSKLTIINKPMEDNNNINSISKDNIVNKSLIYIILETLINFFQSKYRKTSILISRLINRNKKKSDTKIKKKE